MVHSRPVPASAGWCRTNPGQYVKPDGSLIGLLILRPDGTLLTSVQVTSHEELDTEPLPETGTYTVVVQLFSGATTANLKLTLSEPKMSSIENQSAFVELKRPGQDARLTFEGTKGRSVELHIKLLDLSPVDSLVGVSIHKADGKILGSAQVAPGADFESEDNIITEPLDESGICTVVVNPFAGAMSARVLLELRRL